MRKTLNIQLLGTVLAVVLLLTAAPASAATFCLRADVTTLTMPDGEVVTMWGFAEDSSAGAGDGDVTIPGPTLVVPPGDTTLTIQLENNLPAGNPVSLIIPGLAAVMSPVRRGDGRVQSLTHEAASGGSATYTWTNVRPGTFIYHSATQMQVQVQMGLYGAVTKNQAEGEAYSGAAFDQETIVFFSEIDPVIHQAVADGDYGPGLTVTSTIDYQPMYFLINGDEVGKVFAGIEAPAEIEAGTTILLRFINAGLTTKAPFILGGHMTVLAEDGFVKPYPESRFAFDLPALKTKDALFTVPGADPDPDPDPDPGGGGGSGGGSGCFLSVFD